MPFESRSILVPSSPTTSPWWITCGGFEPGFRGGGPVRSLAHIVDTLPDPKTKGDTGTPSLLTLVCRRSLAVGKLEGVDGSRPAGASMAAAATPISDVRGSADYRRAMAAVIARRAIERALARARGEDV